MPYTLYRTDFIPIYGLLFFLLNLSLNFWTALAVYVYSVLIFFITYHYAAYTWKLKEQGLITDRMFIALRTWEGAAGASMLMMTMTSFHGFNLTALTFFFTVFLIGTLVSDHIFKAKAKTPADTFIHIIKTPTPLGLKLHLLTPALCLIYWNAFIALNGFDYKATTATQILSAGGLYLLIGITYFQSLSALKKPALITATCIITLVLIGQLF